MTKRLFNKENIIILLTAIIFLLIFSKSTSPLLHSYCYGKDSDIFKVMGKLWNGGLVPYRDFLDHKGPVIFFIEAIGLRISELVGIILLQFISLLFALKGMIKTSKLFNTNINSLLIIATTLLLLNVYYQAGNYTEEFCLPFLAWSIYWLTRFIRNDDTTVNGLYFIFFGITFGVCAFTRITNAIPLCVLIVVFGIRSIINKKIIVLLKQAICFLVGTSIIVVPFIIYFATKGAVNDLIYATFIYNFRYASDSQLNLTINDILNFILLLVPMIASAVLIIVHMIKNSSNRLLFGTFLAIMIIGTVFQITQFPYGHYYIIWIPIIVPIIFVDYKKLTNNKVLRIIRLLALIGIIAVMLIKLTTFIVDLFDDLKKKNAEIFAKEAQKIEKEYNKDPGKVIAYNGVPAFYLMTDIKPCYRFFILQDWQCSHDKEAKKEFEKDIKSLKAKYIIKGLEKTRMDSFINKKYRIVYSTKDFKLLTLR